MADLSQETHFQKRLDMLKEEYRLQLKSKHQKLVQLWDAGVNERLDSSLVALYELLHQLSESSATFGYPEIALLAKELDEKLKGYMAGHLRGHIAKDLFELHQMFQRLEMVMEEAFVTKVKQDMDGKPPEDVGLVKNRAVYVVEPDSAVADWYRLVLERYGYYPTIFESLDELSEGLTLGKPALVVMDVEMPEGPEAGFDYACRLREVSKDISVIFVTSRTDFASRLKALRTGAQFHLSKPVNQNVLVAAVQEVVDKCPVDPYRVLVIDNNTSLVECYQPVLRQANIHAIVVTKPENSLRMLDNFVPELIFLNVNMESCTGLEVGQVIRQQVEYANIPLLFFGDEPAEPKLLEQIRLFGDDFVLTPTSGVQIRENLLVRLKRARMINQYLNELLGQMSFKDQHDDLTGLPNRKQLEYRIAIAMRNVKEGLRNNLSLLLLDVDNFQHVNDAYGHEKGDALLVDLSRRLESSLPYSAIISRPGGDEFAILYKSLADENRIQDEAQRLLKLCELPFIIDNDEVRLSISIGIASYRNGMADLDEKALFKQADTALFRAKHSGKNDFVEFEQQMESELVAQVSMTSDLRKALLNDEFHLMFQPQVSLANDGLFGAEVLIRWQHPQRGLISPGEFIPVAEIHGLIDQLGEYVMRSSVRQIATWRQNYGYTIPLAVNVSPRQFARSDFVEQVASLLSEYHVEGRLLELEITESALAKDIDTAVDKLMRLKKIGVRMAVDDFGTGFSNLASLKRYPVDVLKIDRSFIRDLPNDGDNLAIVTAIVQMAKTLGLKLLAEGVESAEQMEIMRNQQCDLIQGFYIARPMDLEQFEERYLKPMQNQDTGS